LGLSLLAILLLVGSAFAQDNLTVWYGGTWTGGVWTDTSYVPIGAPFLAHANVNVDIPVWYQCTAGAIVADMHLPLGVADAYIDDIPVALCNYSDYYPFNFPGVPGVTAPGWDDASFLGTFETSPPNVPGYHSRSFLGFSDTGGLPNMRLYSTTVAQCLRFNVHFPVVDTGFVYNVLRDGASTTLGGPGAGDTLGGAGFPVITHYAVLVFTPILNVPPEIVAPVMQAEYCTAGGVYNFQVTDGNAKDTATMVTTVNGVPVAYDSYSVDPVSGVVTINYHITIDLFASCASGLTQYVITANDGTVDAINSPQTRETFLNPMMKVDMPDANWFWPGYTDSIPVIWNGACCIGGFELTVMYDNSVFVVDHVTKGPGLEAAEYWFVNYNPSGLAYCAENEGRMGALKVVMVYDLNNQTDPDPLQFCPQSGSTLFWIVGTVLPGSYPASFCVPICFYMCGTDLGGGNYQWNSITNPTGENVWKTEGCQDAFASTFFLDLGCGNIKIRSQQDVTIGDINENGQAYEIGDVVMLANYLSDPSSHPLEPWQIWAADINRDGVPATIADLIMLIRIVTNQIPIPNHKIAPIDVVAAVNMSGDNVTVASEATLGGAVITINHTGELGAPTAEGIDIQYSDRNGVMTVLAYNKTGNALGNSITINVPIVSGTATLATANVADINGHTLNSQTANVAIPTEFSVAQNYPNPFNVKTAIRVALPTSANVAITIYNVAGQLVQTINAGELAAGTHSIIWDASNVGSGVYFYKVAAGDQTRTLKMTLLK
jgi:hypothetical protein